MLHHKPGHSPKSSKPLHEIVYPAQQMRRLLVVGEEEDAVLDMEAYFATLGWQVDCAFEQEEAEALLCFRSYAAVVTDLSLSGTYRRAGLEIVSHVRARCPHTSVFLWHSHQTPELEYQVRQRGGVDGFLPLPHSLAEVAHTVSVAAEKVYV